MSRIKHARRPGFLGIYRRELVDVPVVGSECSDMINLSANDLINDSGDSIVYCPPDDCDGMVNNNSDCLVDINGNHLT